MKRLEFSEKSLEDIEGILTYIGGDRPIAAIQFAEAIIQQCESLARSPGLGESRVDLAPGLRLFSFRNYGIYFSELDNAVRVERILHGAMDVRPKHFK